MRPRSGSSIADMVAIKTENLGQTLGDSAQLDGGCALSPKARPASRPEQKTQPVGYREKAVLARQTRWNGRDWSKRFCKGGHMGRLVSFPIWLWLATS